MSQAVLRLAKVLLLLCVPVPVFGAPAPREITFEGAGGIRLSGTLLLPEGASADRRVPAVVLVAGSGPTDRNGNQPPLLWTGLLKQLADMLAEAGIASLRYDKRGQYRSGKPPGDAKALGEFVAWDHYVADVEAAYRALGEQQEVDPARRAIVGHSEGGLLAMHAAIALQEGPGRPAAVVLLSTPGRPLDVVLREQLAAGFKRQGLADGAAAALLAENDQIIAAIRDGGEVPRDVPAALAPLYPPYIGRFLQRLLELDPADLANKLRGPVLVVQGRKDLQVSAERDAPRLEAALRGQGRANPCEVVLLDGASHNLKRTAGEADHAFFGPVVPELRAKLVGWLGEVFGQQ